MMRLWPKLLLAATFALLLGLLIVGVALADNPTAPTGVTKPSAHVYYDIAEVRYSLHGTRLQSCSLCHSGGAGSWALNAYGTALNTQLGGNFGNGAIEVTNHKTIWDAIVAIENRDSDGDGAPDFNGTTNLKGSNGFEMWSLTFPGDANDKYEAVPSTTGLSVHGNYGETPDKCARCHRTHTAVAPMLLNDTQQGLCFSCHDGTVAATNVKDGRNNGDGLRGGGFVNTFMNTSVDANAPNSRQTTSIHTVDASPATMWGWGAINSGAGKANATLECGNCHNPHMPTWSPDHGTTSFTQYRMLQGSPRESGTGENAQARYFYLTIPEEYDSNGNVVRNYAQTYDAATHRPDTSYVNDRLGEFCALCHTRYMAVNVVENSADSHASGPGHKSSGDSIFMYRHATKEASCSTGRCHSGTAVSRPRCLDCHTAHGTSAVMNTNSAAVPLPGETSPATSRSSLLRSDNRGVCAACHEW